MRRRRRSRPSIDPRALVAAGFLLVLAMVAASGTAQVRWTDKARRSVRHVQVAVERPLGHLRDALQADTAGQALLQRAAASTGDQRATLLSQSVAAAETATKAWTRYRASALRLPGEAALAAAYERDYAAGKAVAGSVLVLILQAGAPAPLPEEQVVAAELDRRDLLALQALYQHERGSALRALDQQLVNARGAVLVGSAAAAVLVLVGLGFALRSARRAVTGRRTHSSAVDLADFEGRLTRALEFTDSDDDAFRVASRALTKQLPRVAAAVVVADTSQTRLAPITAEPSCHVTVVQECRAARAGVPLQFNDSGSLDACPVLASWARTPCAATCVPVTVAGTLAAVVQLTGPVGAPPDMGAVVPLIVRRLGDRLATLRALERFQLLASHDPLTGLLNRRSLEDAVDRLTSDDTPYAVAFADLDHFKLLNDEHGHDVGDGTLRSFAETLKTTVRPDDLVGRWGGEEFVIVLPDCDQDHAIEAMDRVRTQLVTAGLEASSPAVTVSVGVAVRNPAEAFGNAVARADTALYLAKKGGRDRIEAWEPSPGGRGR